MSVSKKLTLICHRTIATSSICSHYGGTWKNSRRLQNPAVTKEIPTVEYKKDRSFKKTKLVYVCGFAATGALGLPRYYNPEKKSLEELRKNDTVSSKFKRLPIALTTETIRDIACGYGFTLLAAKLENSSQSCLGFGLNSHSQIGYHVSRPGFPLEIVTNPSPVFLPTDKHIVAVSCGRSHSLSLNNIGQVFALGNNSFGQCGRPIIKDEQYFGSKKVNQIQDLPTVAQVHCGQDHSMFITDNGELFACGWGADGQTGLGHYNNEIKPTRVMGDLEHVKVVKVSCCADTVLALDDRGNVFGWGNSEYAQFSALAKDDSQQFNTPRHLDMINVPGKIVDIAAGGTICAVLNDKGHMYVWGFGILGKGPDVDHLSYPTLLPETLFGMNSFNPDTKVEKIYAGLSQLAAITNKGDLFTWGRNRGSALGLTNTGPQYFPMQVNMNLAAVKKVSLGVDHTCAIVEKVC